MHLGILEGALGGIGLFLLGMKLMSDGIRFIADDRIRSVLSQVTSNRYLSLLFGISMTLAVSSGSAAVIFAVGLLNGGVLNVFQALCVLSGVLLGSSLSLHLHLIPYSLFSGFFILGGFIVKYFFSNRRLVHYGTLLLGIGLLFFGLSLLEGSYRPINESHPLQDLMRGMLYRSAFMATLFGAIVSFLVQSSQSTISIIVSLEKNSSMISSLSFAMSCGGMLGMSAIGLLASVGGKYVARRVAMILMLVTLMVCLPLIIFSQTGADISYEVAALFDGLDRRNVLSWGYTISCSLAALILFVSAGPFSRLLHKTEANTNGRAGGMQPAAGYLDRRILITPPIALEQARKEVQRMATVATWMYADVLAILSDFDARRVETIRQHEQLLDSLNSEITSFLAALSKSASGPDILYEVPGLMQIVSALEHIGDVSEDILDCTLDRKATGIIFSQDAMNDLIAFAEQVGYILAKTEKFISSGENYNRDDLHHIKTRTRQLYDQIKESHFSRISSGVCPPRSAILFQEMSSSCMRIAELCWNILGISFRRTE